MMAIAMTWSITEFRLAQPKQHLLIQENAHNVQDMQICSSTKRYLTYYLPNSNERERRK